MSTSDIAPKVTPGGVLEETGLDLGAVKAALGRMLLIRHFEDQTRKLFTAGRLPGFVHLYIGQEAVAVGACTALEPLEQLLRRLRGLRSQAIHGDCHGRNLLVNDAGDACVGIIDLGDMIHAPLALEIAVAMAELLTDEGYEVVTRDLLMEDLTEVALLAHVLLMVDVFVGAQPTGWEFIQHLKTHPATAPIPIMLCTAGKLTPHQVSETEQQGITVVYKPFELDDLLHLVHTLVGASRSPVA